SEGIGERPEAFVLGSLHPPPPRHAEAADRRLLEGFTGQQLEEFGLLGVRRREARLDELDSECVQGVYYPHFFRSRERHAVTLHAVPQGRVVELHLFHRMCPFRKSKPNQMSPWGQNYAH